MRPLSEYGSLSQPEIAVEPAVKALLLLLGEARARLITFNWIKKDC